MTKFQIISISILLALITFGLSCNKENTNPNIPNVVINITIDPNSTVYQELNTQGGYLYLDEQPGIFIPSESRGIIVYRETMSTFKAYERQPPNDPYLCCDSKGNNCTKLIVGEFYPFAKDTCNGNLYYLPDGNLFEGEGKYPLIQYSAVYAGGLLHIYN